MAGPPRIGNDLKSDAAAVRSSRTKVPAQRFADAGRILARKDRQALSMFAGVRSDGANE